MDRKLRCYSVIWTFFKRLFQRFSHFRQFFQSSNGDGGRRYFIQTSLFSYIYIYIYITELELKIGVLGF